MKGAPGLFLGRETCTIDGVSGAHAPKLDVTYTNDASAVSAWLADALGGGNGVGEGGGVAALGIDTETKPRFSKPVPGTPDLGPALLQLATDDGRCLVVQLSGKSWRHGDTKALVAALQPVLGDAAIPKVDAVGRSVGRWERPACLPACLLACLMDGWMDGWMDCAACLPSCVMASMVTNLYTCSKLTFIPAIHSSRFTSRPQTAKPTTNQPLSYPTRDYPTPPH